MPSIAEKEARIIISKYGMDTIVAGFMRRDKHMCRVLRGLGETLNWHRDWQTLGDAYLEYEGYELVRQLSGFGTQYKF